MQYDVGESLADYGFHFFEKLHSPIFLFHKSGELRHINEAGRKLLLLLQLPKSQLDDFSSKLISAALAPDTTVEYQRIATSGKHFRIISQKLGHSDFVLVEVVR